MSALRLAAYAQRYRSDASMRVKPAVVVSKAAVRFCLNTCVAPPSAYQLPVRHVSLLPIRLGLILGKLPPSVPVIVSRTVSAIDVNLKPSAGAYASESSAPVKRASHGAKIQN